MDDALFAKLLGMGFEFEQIQRCYEALSKTATAFNLQKATEWLLDQSASGGSKLESSSNTLVLTPPTGHIPTGGEVMPSSPPDIHKPVSSSRDLSAMATEEPLTSRYNLGTSHVRDKERFAMKEREEALKKARERRKADILAKERVRKEILADKRARAEKAAPFSEQPTGSTVAPPTSEGTPSIPSVAVAAHTTCRVQVRLPSGHVLRTVLPASATLNDIIEFVVSNDSNWSSSSMTLMQPFPRHEYTPAEGQRSLEALGLCPSTSLVVSDQKAKEKVILQLPEPMEVDDEKTEDRDQAPSDDSGSDSDSGNGSPLHQFPPIGLHRPLPQGRHAFNPFNPAADESFGGQGHRLGGREGPMVAGDTVRQSQRATQAARTAAIQRRDTCPQTSHTPTTLSLSPHPLSSLCIQFLVAQSNQYSMPSCASVSPLLAHKLIAALKEAKKLNSKTLMAFYRCPIRVLQLDNYLFTTNELLANLSHFPGLQELSLCSCPIITDRAMSDMLPYLSMLTHLKLNGCSQLSQAFFRALRGCKDLEVLELSHVKVADEGLQQLLYYSLQQLRELDLSYTQVTAAGLRFLPEGAPSLERLSIENTLISDYSSLPQLPHLNCLNLSRCPAPSREALEVLGRCTALETLVMSGIELEGDSLERLAGLRLKQFKLPDRNTFLDISMETVTGFPLVVLDLSDYLHITDAGISLITGMTSLTSLSLSRTKLTDAGMPFLEGLSGLRELCLDNTLVTDEGISHVAGLVHLEVLSLADTRVTSKFIIDGVLKKLQLLNKLNLSRTAVCDRGMQALALFSLTMLNMDWTCITMATTLSGLKSTGCPVLETFRNRNIEQPLPRSAAVQGGDMVL